MGGEVALLQAQGAAARESGVSVRRAESDHGPFCPWPVDLEVEIPIEAWLNAWGVNL